MKRIILISVFSAATLFATAQDTIQLTWQGGTNKEFGVGCNAFGPSFLSPIRINWGDGFMTDTITELYVFSGHLTHSYADTTRNYAVTITSYSDTVLVDFYCPYQQISHLDVSRCTYFFMVNCTGNRIPLSELYKISRNVKSIGSRGLGVQYLLPQRILVGDSVDFSDQNEFDGIFTVFNLIKNSSPAVFNVDYTIYNGIISLKTAGLYTITMTNDNVLSVWVSSDSTPSHWYAPAKVIAEINVELPNTDANLSFLSTSSGELTPKFDSLITNYTVCVGYNVQEILLKATASDPKASLSGTGTIKLVSDTTILTVTVTAEDGITTKDYVVTVIKGCEVGIATIDNGQLIIEKYEIFNIMGTLLLSQQSPLSPEEINHFPQGIYILKIQTNKGIIIKKVINQ